MNLIEGNLKDYPNWSEVKEELAIKCSDIIEPTNDDLKNKLIDDLYNLQTFLSKKGFEKLDFMKEEIKLYSNTTQMSLYQEEIDMIGKDVIEKYARLSHDKEGIIGISKKFTYEQIKRLTNGVYKKTGMIKFYISNEKKIPGKIVAETYEHPQNISIATLLKSKGVEDFKKVLLWGENFDKKKYSVIKEIEVPVYVYKFISDQNKEMVLFSIEKLMIGDYEVTGMETKCNDYKMLTASSKLMTKLPYLFVQEAKSRITLFKNHEQLKTKLDKLKVNYDTLYNYLFTLKLKKKNKLIQLKYNDWFKKLMWAWLIHRPQGLEQEYPMHLYIAGPPATGKSYTLKIIHQKVRETSPIFSGTNSTLKKLVPSFKHMPMQHGYLAESNRFAFCDEFLRCIVNSKSSNANSERDESVGMMNDLLEHEKKVVGSGVSSGTVSMTARILAVSNPVRGTTNMEGLLKNLDNSFLSRWVVYYQSKEDIDLVRSSEDDELESYNYSINDYDFVSIVDYMHSIYATFDKKKIVKIYDESKPLLTEELLKHYNSRQKHHITCLMDGIIKTRCLMSGDMDFTATDKDYEDFRIVWANIVRSWIDFDGIRKLHINKRIYYMPEICQYLYKVIDEHKKELTQDEFYELVSDEMDKDTFIENLIILTSNQILSEKFGKIRPHWMKIDLGDEK